MDDSGSEKNGGQEDNGHEMEKTESRRPSGWNILYQRLLNTNQEKKGRVSYLERLQVRSKLPGATHGDTRVPSYVRMQPTFDLFYNSSSEPETVDTAKAIKALLAERDKWIIKYPIVDAKTVEIPKTAFTEGYGSNEPEFLPHLAPPPPPCNATIKFVKGVHLVYWDPDKETNVKREDNKEGIQQEALPPLLYADNPIPEVDQFLLALQKVMLAVQSPECKTFSYQRLQFLDERFTLHLMFNSAAELEETQANRHRDFYNVRKVDTHVHHSACMQQKHLLRFIRKKHRQEGETIVMKDPDGTLLKLKDVFARELCLSAYEVSTDSLNVHALGSCFQRFDRFNSKYNPFGQKALREIFLKTENYIDGRYLAEITREVIDDMEDSKYQHAEWRISIYGKSYDEWEKLAKWVIGNKLCSKRVRWIIQVPRLYSVYSKLKKVKSFGELLKNIFEPVFAAVKEPQKHPEIYQLLLQTVAWDSVDDESRISKYTMKGGELPTPDGWTDCSNPPYSYWGYYMYANIRSLNHFLIARGMHPLKFRPHCGEAGSISHLATMFLLADGINHGVMLRKSPVLQYLYYLKGIGLAVSPLSNNALFIELAKHPFKTFFNVGMNTSLSTDDPLMFHFTDEALLEEYSLSAHTWKLSPVDLCELARNSVLQSGWEEQYKRHWLGENYLECGSAGNDIQKTNVSNIRLQFRHDTLQEELHYIDYTIQLHSDIEQMPSDAPLKILASRSAT